MKKLLSLLAFAGMLFVVSCSDDDEASLPTLTAPAEASTGLGETASATFSFVADAGFASSSVSGTGVDASVTTDGTAGASSGDITVEYTVTALGSNSVVLSITDGDGNSVEATLVVTSNSFTTEVVEGNITADATWSATTVYELSGTVAVEAGVTLTIEAGTIIKGQPGTSANAAALLVLQGATLNAMGTASAPIIFTASSDEIAPGEIVGSIDATVSGLWGGVIILGNAPISAAESPAPIEGIPTSVGAVYGGSDAADNSGTITYISIRHGGSEIAPGNEINGLTLGGVGSATTINNVEVVANKDDGIEWFGGTVDVSNVVVWNAGDDGLDTDQDWIGTCSDFIVVTPTGGSAFELDGPEGTTSTGQVHTFNNGTVFAGELGEELVDLDGSTNASMTNIYFYGISTVIVVESFGGDGVGEFSGWEYTLPSSIAVADVFVDVPSSILTEVAENQNTVGPDATNFGWTFAGASGALASIGL